MNKLKYRRLFMSSYIKKIEVSFYFFVCVSESVPIYGGMLYVHEFTPHAVCEVQSEVKQ